MLGFLRPPDLASHLGQHATMDLLTLQGGPYARHVAEAGGGFDVWLNDYLLEVLPTETPSLLLQNEGHADMIPQLPPGDFLEDPLLDAEMLSSVGQDHASSNSGEFSNEQPPAQLGSVSDRTTSKVNEADKLAQRAARVADKNRCRQHACFVASRVDLVILRMFRDRTMLQAQEGTEEVS